MDQFSKNKPDVQDIIPSNTLKTQVPQVHVERKITHAPSRYRNELAKYIIFRDETKCTLCGECVRQCPKGVHNLKQG